MNFVDWDRQNAKRMYEFLTSKKLPVIVMEPLQGGRLAELTPAAVQVLKQADATASAASWAFRYLAALPNVLCILSGMMKPEHLADNLRTFSPVRPLTAGEKETLEKALTVYRKQLAIPCTACKYCMPCPAGVEIPKIFGLYNQYKISGNRWLFTNNYRAIPKDSRANACIECGECMKHCPQHLRIPELMKKIASEAGKV